MYVEFNLTSLFNRQQTPQDTLYSFATNSQCLQLIH